MKLLNKDQSKILIMTLSILIGTSLAAADEQFYWTAEKYEEGEIPEEWEDQSNIDEFEIREDSEGNRYLGIDAEDDERSFLEYIEPSDSEDTEIYTTWEPEGDHAVFGRGQDTDDIDSVSALRGDFDTGDIRLSYFDDGDFEDISSTEAPSTDIFNTRFRIEGEQFSHKAWEEGDSEPEDFQLEETYDGVTGEGSTGVFHWTEDDLRIYDFGVGIEGTEAPTNPVENEITLRKPESQETFIEGDEVEYEYVVSAAESGEATIYRDDESIDTQTVEEGVNVLEYEEVISESDEYEWYVEFEDVDGEILETSETRTLEIKQELDVDFSLNAPEENEEFGGSQEIDFEYEIDTNKQGDAILYLNDDIIDETRVSTGETQIETTEELQTDQYEWYVQYETDEQTQTSEAREFEILEDFFEINITDTNSPVEPEEDLEIEYVVENIGDEEGSQTINLIFDEDETDQEQEITLNPGETEEDSFSYTIEEDEGLYEAEIETENDIDNREIQVSPETFGDQEICGENAISPEEGNYNEIIIDGEITVCDDGATLEANDLIQITDSGSIVTNIEDAPDGEEGEDAPDLALTSNQVQSLGEIDLSGADGGDGDGGRDNGYDGGDGGIVDITSFEEPKILEDQINVEGGDGGEPGGAAVQGGDGGDGGTIELSYSQIEEDDAELLIEEGEGGEDANDGIEGEIIRNNPEIIIDEVDSEGIIPQGIEHEVTLDIENQGNFQGFDTIEYYFDVEDEEPTDQKETDNLDIGETDTITLTKSSVDREPDDYFQLFEAIESGDTVQEEITVAEEEIIFRDVSTNSPVTEEDEDTLEVDTIIENTGDVEGSQEIELYFDSEDTEGEPSETKETSELGSGDLESLDFELDVSDETDGEYNVQLASEDDEVSRTIVIGDEPYFEVDITDTNDPVEIGEELEVEAEIENVGGETDEQQIEFEFDDETEETFILELESGESSTEEFNYNTSDEEPDEYEVSVISEDEEEDEQVFIGQGPYFDVDILNLEEEISSGDLIEFDVDVENIGDFADTQDINFFFDGNFEESEESSLEGGESELLDFDRETDSLPDGVYDIMISSEDTTDSAEVQIGDYVPADGDTEYEYLELVEFNTLDNLNDNDDDGYIDFTHDVEETQLKRGETYNVELSSDASDGAPDERPESGPGGGGDDGETEWDHFFSLWADWEQDLEFDTEVQVDECVADSDTGCTVETEFTIPENAELGETRVRTFVLGDEEDGDYVSSPTTDNFDGQSHDYNVEVVDSDFQVSDIESEDVVSQDQTIQTNATIENVGDADGEQDIQYRFDEEKTDTDDIVEEVSIESGEQEEITFEYTVDEDEGDYTQEISTDDDSRTRAISVDTANYLIDTSTNSPIQEEDEDLEVEAEITNEGVVSEPQDIEFFFDGELEDVEENFELEPDETETIEFVKEDLPDEDGEYTAEVTSDDDSSTSNVIIGTDPFFEVEISSTNSPIEFVNGEDLNVVVDVENVGGTEDTQDIELLVHDLEEASQIEEDQTLEPSDETQISFDIDIDELEPGEYDIEAISEDDSDIDQIEIIGYELPEGDTDFEYLSLVQIEQEDGELGIDNPSGDDDGYADFTEEETGEKAILQRGEEYEITMASDLNDEAAEGDEHYFNIFADWNQNIEFDQDPIDLDSCEAAENGCEITTTFTVPEDAELGDTRLRTFLQYEEYQDDPVEEGFAGEAEDYSIEIADSEFTITEDEIPTEAESGDTIRPNVTIENTGAEPDSQDIEFLFDGDVIDTVDETLDTGDQTEEEFTYELSEDKEEGETFEIEIRTEDDEIVETLEIILVEGELEITLQEPQEDITTNTDEPFDVEAEVACIEGDCGETEVLTQYNESGDTPDTEISTSLEADEPFYIEGEENTQSCGELTDQDSCTVNWEVVLTESGELYAIDAQTSSENAETIESEKRLVSSAEALILETGFEEVDFGSAEPSGDEDDLTVLEALENNEGVYTVSLDDSSAEPEDGLWMKSTPLEHTGDEDGENAVIGSEHTLFGFNEGSDQCEDFESTDTDRSSESFQQIQENFEPGDQEEKCYFQEIPNGKYAGQYEGTLSLKVNGTQ